MQTRDFGSIAACFLIALGFTTAGIAQVATGTPPFGSFGGGPDVINLANLNAHISVPVLQKAGRGLPFSYILSYDTSVWYPTSVNGVLTWQPLNNWGWRGQTEVITGYVSAQESTTTVTLPPVPGQPPKTCTIVTLSGYTFHDSFGVAHSFPTIYKQLSNTCASPPYPSNSGPELAPDGSGYTYNAGIITERFGSAYVSTFNSNTGSGTATDTNGNQITANSSGQFFDTLSSTTPVLTISGTAPNPVTYTYTPPAGGSASYTVNYTNYTVRTNFGCSGSSAVAEYGPASVSLVSSIQLPDGTSYSFTYEPTAGYSGDVTGRLASVTLPTGGTISYTYTAGSNGITCADGSAAGLTRTTPDGTWTYARTLGSGGATTTTITDPTSQANQTVINFQGIYETERQIYQGAQQPSNLLKTRITCYNGNTSNCSTTGVALPITQRTVTTQWGQSGLQKEINILYDSYGNVTEKDEYDYGSGVPGALLRKTLTSYTAFSNFEKPSQITVEDGSGNIKAQTSFGYDQSSVTATSGTPQQVSVSGSRGNLTGTTQFVAKHARTLSRTFTYYDTGNVNTATDVNGAQTTYTYNSTGCANSFPTQVSLPLSLSRSMAWNCTGGVTTSVTDENGNTSSTTYTDPYFWRPASTTDQANYVTNITYTGQTQVESVLSFNGGNSVADTLTVLDSLGRTHVGQQRQGPGSSTFDTTEADYDSVGRASRTTVPYPGSAGQTNSSAPATTMSYDALNRPSQITDGGGGSATLSYTQNDVLRTVGPAPQNENTKRSQQESDGLGRLASVCEVTSASGSGNCAQTSAQTGYWTKYTYDVLDDIITVAQNAQATAQNRSYGYDGLKRLTSETNPESGTTTYTYDSDATCGTSNGDLVKRVDAVGNTTCYSYDLLHRKTKVSYSGPYASATPAKCFVYDSATLNSTSMANAKNRLAEAYTTTSASCTGTGKIADTYLSYSVRGELTDVYESTPHSEGYYHSTASYWANRAVNTLNPLNSTALPIFTYGLDGEGRAASVSASSGTNPVNSATYNVASKVTGLTFGSSDSDSFGYDSNTFRMTNYTVSVGANPQTVTGNLTWNANGTLQQLAITDQFNSANTQTCTYLYDDLMRIAGNQTNPGVNCGSSVWQQYFTYDAFGNLNKSVPTGGTGASFQPTYNSATNQMSALPGFTPTYDANGNTTADSLHTYSWDAESNSVSIDSIGLTFDALGKIVEEQNGSSYTQVLYGPTGKLALMSGQSVTKAFVLLPAGAAAVYTSGPTLSYFRHPDWLGSSRFASTPARTMYSDLGYAPFGETYAESGTPDRSFTGQNQDTMPGSTTGLYDFAFREHNQYGRWISPDPLGMGAADPSDPQSWNRYAYVTNTPTGTTDPLGLNHLATAQLADLARMILSSMNFNLPCIISACAGGTIWGEGYIAGEYGSGPPCFMCGQTGGYAGVYEFQGYATCTMDGMLCGSTGDGPSSAPGTLGGNSYVYCPNCGVFGPEAVSPSGAPPSGPPGGGPAPPPFNDDLSPTYLPNDGVNQVYDWVGGPPSQTTGLPPFGPLSGAPPKPGAPTKPNPPKKPKN
jgi:RHS repeat-associated protein